MEGQEGSKEEEMAECGASSGLPKFSTSCGRKDSEDTEFPSPESVHEYLKREKETNRQSLSCILN